MIWLGLALAGPELVSNRVWSSPFEAVGARSEFVLLEVEGRAVEVGVSAEALRVFVEEAPGEPWRGPLTLTVDGTEVSWPEASTPRSVPDKTIYEASFDRPPSGALRFVDGPVAGMELELPGPRRTRWELVVTPVLLLWGLGRLMSRA